MKLIRQPGPGRKELEVALKGLEGKVAKVGWFANAKYPDTNMHVAQVAVVQEYGLPQKNIPPRPFLRPTVINKREEWGKLAERGVRAILKGRIGLQGVMEGLGQKAAGDVREKITQIFSPPLSPVTIYNRLHRKSNKKTIGSLTKPLVDTGILLGTCTNSVEDE